MNTIEVRIYNPDLELQGIIDEFSSLIWIRRYQAPGEFELHTPYSEESRQLLVTGNIVHKFDGNVAKEAGVIESLQMNKDEIVIKGRFWELYMEFHTMTGTYASRDWGPVETLLRHVMTFEFAAIPLLALGEDHGLTEAIDFQATNKTLLNTASKLCRATALGFRIWPDFEAKKMFFEVYKGVDRSSASASKVIFSETYDNLTNESYTLNITNYRNAARIVQIDDNGTLLMAYYGDGDTGINARLMPVMSSVETNGRTAEQINEAMRLVGETALVNRQIAETFTFATDPEGAFKYREDYDLGDLVIINHNAWNIHQTRRITEVEEDYEGGKVTIIPTCGDPLPESVNFEEGY